MRYIIISLVLITALTGIAFTQGGPAGTMTKLPVTDKMLTHHSARTIDPLNVDTIILHYTSAIYVTPEDPFNTDTCVGIWDRYKVSPHYWIDRAGKLFRTAPEHRKAWHAGKGIMADGSRAGNINNYSIGIEIACAPHNATKFSLADRQYTDAQYETINALIADIRSRYTIPPENILGHDQIGGERVVGLGFRPNAKIDPGPYFDWDRIWKALDLYELSFRVTNPEEIPYKYGGKELTQESMKGSLAFRVDGDKTYTAKADYDDYLRIFLPRDKKEHTIEISAASVSSPVNTDFGPCKGDFCRGITAQLHFLGSTDRIETLTVEAPNNGYGNMSLRDNNGVTIAGLTPDLEVRSPGKMKPADQQPYSLCIGFPDEAFEQIIRLNLKFSD
jgi:N-acetyl-anhydromuramyl-L-alanine amidase AmpD